MTATATKEELKPEIIKILKGFVGMPVSFWDILLSLSRYARPEGRFVKEFDSDFHPLEINYKGDDVQEALKAIQELFREGMCQLTIKNLEITGSFDGTLTHAYELALTVSA